MVSPWPWFKSAANFSKGLKVIKKMIGDKVLPWNTPRQKGIGGVSQVCLVTVTNNWK